jgi:hypothetical protein
MLPYGNMFCFVGFKCTVVLPDMWSTRIVDRFIKLAMIHMKKASLMVNEVTNYDRESPNYKYHWMLSKLAKCPRVATYFLLSFVLPSTLSS